MSAASKFTDTFPEELIRGDFIPKDVKRGEIICFQKARKEAERKAEKATRQEVAK